MSYISSKFFTLVELIVVIVVISILAAIVMPNIADIKSKAKTSALIADSKNIELAVDIYVMQNKDKYPTTDRTQVYPQDKAPEEEITEIIIHPETNESITGELINLEELIEKGLIKNKIKNKNVKFYLIEGGTVVWFYNELNEENKDTTNEEEIQRPIIKTEALTKTKENSTGKYLLSMYIQDESGIVGIKGFKDTDYKPIENTKNIWTSLSNYEPFILTKEDLINHQDKELEFGFKNALGNTSEFTIYIDRNYIYCWEKGNKKAYLLSFNLENENNPMKEKHLIFPTKVKDKTIYGIKSVSLGDSFFYDFEEVTFPESYQEFTGLLPYTTSLKTINYLGNKFEYDSQGRTLDWRFRSHEPLLIRGKNEQAISKLRDLILENGDRDEINLRILP